MLVDITKTAFENMLDLVNTTNGTEYTADDVSFGIPEVYADPAFPDYNTKISMNGLGEYSGVMDLFYNRLELDREIMYRNYKGGDFDSVASFLKTLETLNEIRGDNVKLELSAIPDGTARVTAKVLPSDNSMLYTGSREIIFNVMDGYVPPVIDPSLHYDIDVPAGSLNDMKQTFASTARVVGSIELTTLDDGSRATKVEYVIKDDFPEAKERSYPIGALVDRDGARLCVIGKTLKDSMEGEYYTRLVSDGEEPFTTARGIRLYGTESVVTKVMVPKSELSLTTTPTVDGVKTTYSFVATLVTGLSAILAVSKEVRNLDGQETHSLNYTVQVAGESMANRSPTSEVWKRLGERVLGGVEFFNAAGTLLLRIDAPTYGYPLSKRQNVFWDNIADVTLMKVELVSITP